ncbi:hypothetical protein AB0I53_43210 [Saccharopolyspora sp. NPDC050389]|uniref:hypothetical protein n=1 Tax=Saccharopolyspora sp. NPDC050389 TaxID=3155516 RepID=UPI0033DB7603
MLEVSLPRNNFPLEPAPEYLFLAGGIGITPIVPMLGAAVGAGAAATLLYAGRSVTPMPFAEDLRLAYGDRARLVATQEAGQAQLRGTGGRAGPGRAGLLCDIP